MSATIVDQAPSIEPAPGAGPAPGALSNADMRARLDGELKVDLVQHMRAAGAMPGNGWGKLISEIWRLSKGPGKLTPEEYFYYRLYDPALSFAEKQRFLGKRAQNKMHAACNDPTWHAVGHDKLLFHACMAGAGLPVAKVLAVHHPFRRVAGAETLATAEQVAAFLRDGMTYPCFAKPIDGMYSLGTYSLQGYDDAGDALLLAGGGRLAMAEFLRQIDSGDYAGYLFQETLRPHPDVARLTGGRLSTTRFVVLLTGSEPEIVRALCKIPVGDHAADNFWRTGNMLAAIDLPSGRIERVVAGVGVAQHQPTHHPDSGESIMGVTMPQWAEARALCLAAAAMLPPMHNQAWDVALTDRGPVLVEVNLGGDFNLPQIAFGQGLLDERFQAHLDACGYGKRRRRG